MNRHKDSEKFLKRIQLTQHYNNFFKINTYELIEFIERASAQKIRVNSINSETVWCADSKKIVHVVQVVFHFEILARWLRE